MNVYLFIYSDVLGSRDEMIAHFDAMEEVEYWRYDLPNSFYVLSKYTAALLSEKFVIQYGKPGRFAFFAIDPSFSQGRLSKETWHLLNKRQPFVDEEMQAGLEKLLGQLPKMSPPSRGIDALTPPKTGMRRLGALDATKPPAGPSTGLSERYKKGL